MNAPVSQSKKPITEIERRIFAPEQIDDVAEALLSLTREVWVLTDRLYVLERVIEANGIPVVEAVNKYQPSEEQAAELEAMRKRLIGELLRTLKAPLPEGVSGSNKFG
jgi:hypothetical protein